MASFRGIPWYTRHHSKEARARTVKIIERSPRRDRIEARGALGAGGRALRSPRDRRRHHRRRHRARRRDARHGGGAGGAAGPGVRHQFAIQPADPRRPALPRTGPDPAGVRGGPRAAHPARHRLPPRLAPRVPLPHPPWRPRSPLEAGGGTVALRPAGALPERPPPSHSRQAPGAGGGADAPGARAPRCRTLRRRPVRRCTARHRHGPRRDPVRCPGGHLDGGALTRPRRRPRVRRRSRGHAHRCHRDHPGRHGDQRGGPLDRFDPAHGGPGRPPPASHHARRAHRGPARAHRQPARHHLPESHRRPRDVHPPLGRALLHRHHRHRNRGPARGSRHHRGRHALPPAVRQRALSRRASRGGRHRVELGRAPPAGPGRCRHRVRQFPRACDRGRTEPADHRHRRKADDLPVDGRGGGEPRDPGTAAEAAGRLARGIGHRARAAARQRGP